jgi:hypothetical protein
MAMTEFLPGGYAQVRAAEKGSFLTDRSFAMAPTRCGSYGSMAFDKGSLKYSDVVVNFDADYHMIQSLKIAFSTDSIINFFS